MTPKQTLEAMMLHNLRTNGSDRIQTSLTHADLKNAGAQYFDGRFTMSVMHEGRMRTFEVLPRKTK